MKYTFTAKEVYLQDEPGYIVCQYREDGEKSVEQFIYRENYEHFCKVIGVEPKIIE